MRRFGSGIGYLAYLIQRALRDRQRQKKRAARERERQSWEVVRRAAAKAKHNLSYSSPFPQTLVLPTKIPFLNECPGTILTPRRRGQGDGE